jgi:hypothetical protein
MGTRRAEDTKHRSFEFITLIVFLPVLNTNPASPLRANYASWGGFTAPSPRASEVNGACFSLAVRVAAIVAIAGQVVVTDTTF